MDIKKETWKDIPKEQKLSRYQISSEGRLKNKRSSYILNPKPNKDTGYISATIKTDDGKQRCFKIHILVALTFIPKVDGKNTVDHINRNRSDNRVKNLRWANRSEQGQNSCSKPRKKGTPIVQMDLDGNFIKRWKKMKDAEDALNICSGEIGQVCRGKRKTAKCFTWKFDWEEVLEGEIWKKCNHFHVSNMGRVKTRYDLITYGYKQGGGYLTFDIDDNKFKVIHVLVAELFIPNPNNFPIVNHLDGNKKNNKVANLEWTTTSGNMLHAHALGLVSKSKILSIAVNKYDLDGNYIKSFESLASAGREMGCHNSAISKVCQGIFKQTGGYSFKFANPERAKVYVSSRKASRKINHVDKEGRIIRKYNSALEAGKDLGVAPSNVHLVCKRTYKQISGHRFKYAE